MFYKTRNWDVLNSFLLDIAERDNSPIILVTFETILSADIFNMKMQ